jgi:hypothetical protein
MSPMTNNTNSSIFISHIKQCVCSFAYNSSVESDSCRISHRNLANWTLFVGSFFFFLNNRHSNFTFVYLDQQILMSS